MRNAFAKLAILGFLLSLISAGCGMPSDPAMETIKKGEAAAEKGDLDLAVAEFTEAIRHIDPHAIPSKGMAQAGRPEKGPFFHNRAVCTLSWLSLPTSIASNDVLSLRTIPWVDTTPPPVMFSVPLPEEPTKILARSPFRVGAIDCDNAG